MAWSLKVPIDDLRFSEIGPRFFSRHAIELAIQRGMGR
jgi:hypothetical protein